MLNWKNQVLWDPWRNEWQPATCKNGEADSGRPA